jgi:hypothetical protein
MEELKTLLLKFAEEKDITTLLETAKSFAESDIKLLKEALTALGMVKDMPVEAKKAVVSLANALKPLGDTTKPLDERQLKFMSDIEAAIVAKHEILIKKVEDVLGLFHKKVKAEVEVVPSGIKEGDVVSLGDKQVTVVSVDEAAGTAKVKNEDGTIEACEIASLKCNSEDKKPKKKSEEEDAKAEADKKKKEEEERKAAEAKLAKEKADKEASEKSFPKSDPFRAALYGKRK